MTTLQRMVLSVKVAALLFLSACSGAGEEAEPLLPAQADEAASAAKAGSVQLDTPAAVPQSDRISLRWTASQDLVTFSVWLKATDAAPFRRIANGLRGPGATVARGPAWKLDFPTARIRVQGCTAHGRCTDSNAQSLLEVLLAGTVKLEPQTQRPDRDKFGPVAVSDDGRTMAVSDQLDYPPVWEEGMTAVGSVSVFQLCDDGHWQRELYFLRPYTSLVGDRSNVVGTALALSGDGNTLAIQVRESSGVSSLYMLARNAQHVWSEQALLENGSGEFGGSTVLSFDGSRLATSEVDGFVVFARDGTQWRREVRFSSTGDWAHNIYSSTVAFSGNGKVLAVPGYSQPGRGEPKNGEGVFVFERSEAGEWVRTAEIRSPRPPGRYSQSFPRDLVLDHEGHTLVVGDVEDNTGAGASRPDPQDQSAPLSGAIHVYRKAGPAAWRLDAFLKSRTALASDLLGDDLSLSRDGRLISSSACGLAVGAPGVRRNHAPDATVTRPPTYWCDRRANYVFERRESGTWAHAATALTPAPARPNEGGGGEFTQARSGNGQTWVYTGILLGQQDRYGSAYVQ